MRYHFDKAFTATAHTLEEQLRAFREMLAKREAAEKQQWVDTVPSGDESTAFSELQKLKGGE